MPREWGPWSATSSTGARYRVGFDWSRSGRTVTVSQFVFESAYSIYKNVTLQRTGDLSGTYTVSVSTSGGRVGMGHGGSVTGSYGGSVTIGAKVTNILHGLTCSVSESISIPPTTPSAPRNLRAISVYSRSARADWDAPSSNGGASVTYQVSLDGNYYTVSASHRDFSGLAPGSTHFFNVRARNSAGYGPWHGRVYFTTDAERPNIPSRPSVSNIQDDRATVSWSAPNGNGDSVDQYKVVLHKNGSFERSYETSGRSVVWGGGDPLEPNTPYRSAVRAHNSAGWSGYSDYVYWTTKARAPSAPRSPSISQVTSDSLRLTWTAPSDSGGLAVIGYRVQVSTDSSFSNLVYDTYTVSTSRTRTIGGLNPNTRYYARVRASTSAFNGPYSSSVSDVTATERPSAPRSLHLTDVSPTEVTVAWTAPSSNGGLPILGYRVEVADNAAFAPIAESRWPTGTSQKVDGLVPGTKYYIRVYARNDDGYGPASSVITSETMPGVWIGTGSDWRPAILWVGDGTSWVQAQAHVGKGGEWG